MDTLDISLERYYLVVSDLKLAKKIADHILRKRLHEKGGEQTQLIHRALNLSMIVSYCRPFTRNVDGEPKELVGSPLHYLVKSVLGKELSAFHREIMMQRNNVYAHSPSGKRFPFPPKKGVFAFQVDVFAPLPVTDTKTLRSIMKTWLDFLEPRQPEVTS